MADTAGTPEASAAAGGNGFRVVKLRGNYDEALLMRFYNELMVPTFSAIPDELEDVETWQNALQNTVRYDLNLIVLLKDDGNGSFDQATAPILAGVACEYYPRSNCGLLTYIVVSEAARNKGLGAVLVQECIKFVTEAAAQAGQPSGCNALFLETNSDRIPPEQDVMVPAVRRRVLGNLGFRILDYPYVQPALSAEQEKCRDLLFAVHESYLAPLLNAREDLVTAPRGTPQAGEISSTIIRDFMREFFDVLMGEEAARTDEDVLQSDAFLNQRSTVPAFVYI